MNKPLLIGIAGGTGSGKTTFSDGLSALFGDAVTVIAYDNYYKCQDGIAFEERVRTNYDCPEALETELLVEHLRTLMDGREVDIPTYDFKLHTRAKETVRIAPTPVIIVDGILTFATEMLRSLFDIKIYADADADERILRRLKRDVTERGRDIDGVINQYLTTVKQMHEIHVEPTKKYADIVINGGKNKIALGVVAARIEERLREVNYDGR